MEKNLDFLWKPIKVKGDTNVIAAVWQVVKNNEYFRIVDEIIFREKLFLHDL